MEYIHSANLAAAMSMAIRTAEKVDKDSGYASDSIYTAGLKESLKALQEGKLAIKY